MNELSMNSPIPEQMYVSKFMVPVSVFLIFVAIASIFMIVIGIKGIKSDGFEIDNKGVRLLRVGIILLLTVFAIFIVMVLGYGFTYPLEAQEAMHLRNKVFAAFYISISVLAIASSVFDIILEFKSDCCLDLSDDIHSRAAIIQIIGLIGILFLS